ncbi:SDR family NAD(P)-dependent oxidoreductase [Halalkalibacter hemicellulosilyticus]|uniref:3-oxoacyl-[acyl-carrier protein] reductase n=1 Tax=Halalkalibacter hemicellulosilyticusJCM 9152 TaxID=1236971 RepID=W4QKH7_9BACI|nr:SDR family NAD(P)-dependent oxidoreductase [Halalkalibacter hemicellulosilyticus]GAE32143.1 3-oxoacyl-[acyl-carrier protein] reductase [Halalkalibacter hemicellulosilyticusJCM 9152]
MLLKKKVAFVTGASKGIGRAIALVFAEHGASVIINGRDEEALRHLDREIQDRYGCSSLVLPYDVTDQDEIKSAFRMVKKEYGRLDVLVNNAGILSDGLIGMIQPSQMNQVMDVNVNAALYHMQYASRLMMKQRSGSIVNISSIMGVVGEVGQVVYAASKAAIVGATKSAAKELASTNIRVNAVAPGFIDTDMTRSLDEENYKKRLSTIKMKRAGQPEEVATGVLYLASDMSSYVTGQVLGIDGGMIV